MAKAERFWAVVFNKRGGLWATTLYCLKKFAVEAKELEIKSGGLEDDFLTVAQVEVKIIKPKGVEGGKRQGAMHPVW